MSEIDDHISRRYEIKRRLGKGAYGIVWKAIDRKNNEVVAVKKIYDAFRNPTDAQRTFREITFLREFGSHSNIIKLKNIHRASNNKDIYLVFEYMETDLHNVIKRGNILKDIHKRYIMYQLFKATKFLHSAQVIHRDQKPSNILLNEECHCKIADFGLARSIPHVVDGSGDGMEDPPFTDYVATRYYRAPEILVASKRYTPGIDMWSLGCILAEMLIGKPLFPGSSTINQMERIMATIPPPSDEDIASLFSGYGSSLLQRNPNGTTRPLSDLLHDKPKDAVDLVKRLLVFNPNKRLTAEEALRHPYVSKFYDPADEFENVKPFVPILRDDVQLSVSEYRNKLYEFIRRFYPSCGSSFHPVKRISEPRLHNSHSHHCHTKSRHLSTEELHHEKHCSGMNSSLNCSKHGPHEVQGLIQPQKRYSYSYNCHRHSTDGNYICKHRDSCPHKQTQVLSEGPKLIAQNLYQPRMNGYATHSRNSSKTSLVPKRAKLRNGPVSTVTQVNIMQHSRVSVMEFNSYNPNYGVVTASALQKMQRNLRW